MQPRRHEGHEDARRRKKNIKNQMGKKEKENKKEKDTDTKEATLQKSIATPGDKTRVRLPAQRASN